MFVYMQNKKEHIYIIGIGGKGLNSIAEFCTSKGYKVSGSDIRESQEIENLREKGVSISLQQVRNNIQPNIDVVVHSSVIPLEHPEILQARALGIPIIERAEFLGQLTSKYTRISVAGSHGKSTTSALATLALKSAGENINAITGAFIKELNSYQSVGTSKFCVLEACEYAKSFLFIPGAYTLITSLEKSHMEYYKNEKNMDRAFSEFVNAHPEDSTFIVNGDITKLKNIVSKHKGKFVTCGFGSKNQYHIKYFSLEKEYSIFSIYEGNRQVVKDVMIKIPGKYNILNVSLVFVLLDLLKMNTDNFKKVVEKFRGVGRRFEIKVSDTTVFIDDFAHHPTQVKNLIESMKQFFPDKKICAVFEPRQYHLMKTFLKEYGKSFKMADEVYITNIVPALGDTYTDIKSIQVSDIVKNIKKYSKPSTLVHLSSYEDIALNIKQNGLSDKIVATIGAGSIFKVRDLLLNRVQ